MASEEDSLSIQGPFKDHNGRGQCKVPPCQTSEEVAADKTCSGTGLFTAVFSGTKPYRESMVVYEKENNPQQVHPHLG